MRLYVEFSWCDTCKQGVEFADATENPGVYVMNPCGHTSRFHNGTYNPSLMGANLARSAGAFQ